MTRNIAARYQMNTLFTNPKKNDDLSSTHTSNLPPLFRESGFSLALSAGPAGMLWVRAGGDVINIHRFALPRPAGLAFRRNRLWIGTESHIKEYINVPAAASKLPEDGYDACFVPFRHYTTGDIAIQEMACGGDGRPWFVNARFSCLCTLDNAYSFLPRWQPPFISACVPEDRCRLNGLAMRDGEPAYVSALGDSDVESGWRQNAHRGGVIVDVKRNAVIAEGLCLPQSPRWRNGQLWFLEAGKGLLNAMDPDSGAITPVVELPGFARGMELAGDVAFIGLSKSMPDIPAEHTPLAKGKTSSACGLWLIDIVNGRTIGFIDFKGGVQEIHAVQIIPNARYPEILPDNHPLVAGTYALPDGALKRVSSVESVGDLRVTQGGHRPLLPH